MNLTKRSNSIRLLWVGGATAVLAMSLLAAFGEDALIAGAIAVSLPAAKLGTAKRTLRFGERIERLLVGVYLSGVRDAGVPFDRFLTTPGVEPGQEEWRA